MAKRRKKQRTPGVATDPLGGSRAAEVTRHSPVEALDVAEDIAAAQWIAQQREPQSLTSSGQVDGSWTAWLQRKRPR